MRQRTKTLKETIQHMDLSRLSLMTLCLYIFCIPFQKRIEFINFDTFRYGTYIDYTTITFYVVDAVLAASFLFFLGGVFIKKRNPLKILGSWYARILFFFLLLLTPSLYINHAPLALFAYAQICVGAVFSLLAYQHVRKNHEVAKYLLYALFLSGVFQSFIALAQFFLQKSTGLWILGEPPFSISTLNVAKIFVEDTTYVRAYGTFPHPNVLACFLCVSLSASVTLLYLRRHAILASSFKVLVWSILVLLQFSALLLTFSRTGWLTTFFCLSILSIFVLVQTGRHENNAAIVLKLRSTFAVLFVAVCILVWISLPFLRSRSTISDANGDNAVTERALLINVSRETIPDHFFIGTGLRTFPLQIEKYASDQQLTLANWQYQPVHNVYLLILTETGVFGIVGLCVVVLLAYYRLHSAFRHISTEKKTVILFSSVGIGSYLAVGLFDHHPWDIHQSLFIWLFLVGLGAGVSETDK